MAEKRLLKRFAESSYLYGGSSAYLEAIYEAYLEDPQSVSSEWQRYFAMLPDTGGHSGKDISQQEVRQEFALRAQLPKTVATEGLDAGLLHKQSLVEKLIQAYRSHGHLQAKLNPLGDNRPNVSSLDIQQYGFTHADLDTEFEIPGFLGTTQAKLPLKTLIEQLQSTYCGSIGIEYMHISNPDETRWLQQRLETSHAKPAYDSERKQEILTQLIAAEGLEKFLGSKFVGQKRFSLEGGDALIPLLNQMIQAAGSQGTEEIIIGMAHRGRLNVLINVLGKAPADLFQEFAGKLVDQTRSGDVKYHLGYSSDVDAGGNVVHLALGFNPSHLEIISPVIEGSVRARQERRSNHSRQQVLPVVIHGDAAFAGQGVVMETFNMSQARGYCTGGTVHIVVNNQVGFTTSNPLDARSTLYCTDIAKMVQAPVLHANADDPEAVVFAALIALEYRMKFGKDVVIDLVCYRRHGHNESDEPSMTQPMMYHNIRQHTTVVKRYADALINDKVLDQTTVDQLIENYRKHLEAGHSVGVPLVKVKSANSVTVDWSPYLNQTWTSEYDPSFPIADLKNLGSALTKLPEGFALQKQVEREITTREKMYAGNLPLNWGAAENLAYATLVNEGFGVRISGQDCGRGTFSHRHAVFHDYENGSCYTPLQHVAKEQGQFTVIDSILSEEAVMAFEYGYATAEPRSLVIWEAQFGDFANGAQVVIDQFISSGYQKWGRLCGLVLLLPHGFEGMGPEHSSARLERFMQLCAQHNLQVCVPTTPAQCYHMLRRQIVRPFRKPLVVMTPKSLLRHKLATSSMEELASGEFYLVIPEIDSIPAEGIERVVICSGKVYYDLLESRREQSLDNVAIIRVEQLYPFPIDALKQELAHYTNAKTLVWCQEEPKNQGAWYSSRHNFEACLADGQVLRYAGRAASAAPAVGDMARHTEQQRSLVKDALVGECEA